MFYTNTITENRLKEIKKIWSDPDRLVGANGGCLLSDGTRATNVDGYEVYLLFHLEPKKPSKRALVMECRNLVRNNHLWDNVIPEQERLVGKEAPLTEVYSVLRLDKENAGGFIPYKGDSTIDFEIKTYREDLTTVVFRTNEYLHLYRRLNGKKYYSLYGMTTKVFTFVEKWLKSKGYKHIGFEK